jgi:hypothetical protein
MKNQCEYGYVKLNKILIAQTVSYCINGYVKIDIRIGRNYKMKASVIPGGLLASYKIFRSIKSKETYSVKFPKNKN